MLYFNTHIVYKNVNSTPAFSSLLSDVNPYCNKSGVQITEITWDVVANRTYSYEIRVKTTGKVEGKCTFPISLFL